MTRFREQDRRPNGIALVPDPSTIFVIEDGLALGLVLKERIEEATHSTVLLFGTYGEAAEAIAARRPSLAISGLNLPDAADGEMIELLGARGVPTILFTASFDRRVREKFVAAQIVDYFVKETPDVVDQVVDAVVRLTDAASTGVLIVDDTQSVRRDLAALLGLQRYQVFEADSGAAALAILSRNESIRLVITDFHMPDMDGRELTREIRKRHSAEDLRVIGISSSSDPMLSAAFLKAGAMDFIYRPFIAEEVISRVANNVETIKHMQLLRTLADRDPMTGLFNRRAFFERAHRLLDEARAKGRDGALAVLDIDHFKRVNDEHGHACGDEAIIKVAQAIAEAARRHGALSARIGGEEFVVMFPGMSSRAVLTACEELRLAIAACEVRSDGMRVPLTASLGVASLHEEEGMDNIMNAADQMLYLAKLQGRNRVVSDAHFADDSLGSAAGADPAAEITLWAAVG